MPITRKKINNSNFDLNKKMKDKISNSDIQRKKGGIVYSDASSLIIDTTVSISSFPVKNANISPCGS